MGDSFKPEGFDAQAVLPGTYLGQAVLRDSEGTNSRWAMQVMNQPHTHTHKASSCVACQGTPIYIYPKSCVHHFSTRHGLPHVALCTLSSHHIDLPHVAMCTLTSHGIGLAQVALCTGGYSRVQAGFSQGGCVLLNAWSVLQGVHRCRAAGEDCGCGHRGCQASSLGATPHQVPTLCALQGAH